MVLQVRQRAVDVIGAERAAHTALFPARTEHEVRHNELTPVLKKIGQALLSGGAVENIVFLDLYPGQRAALPVDLIALPG